MSRFEFPLPALHVSTDEINIETKDRYDGSFVVKNAGSGTLTGQILSRCPGLTFDPAEWEGNNQTITYTFNAAKAGIKTGESVEGHAYITTSGGETRLPITARLTKMSVLTAEGLTIANLQDFFEYAKTHPAQARRLFVDSEFYMLLLALGYKYMEVYESLHKDSNRERAMDNFFILSGLKNKTTISVISDRNLEFMQKPGDNRILYGSIVVKKSDCGYIDAPIVLQSASTWLNCYASRFIQSDFDENLEATLNFSIDPSTIFGKYAREVVTIGTDEVEIVYRRTAPVIFRMNRTAFKYEDKGMLEIINNTGADMKVELFCQESYVRFSARSYIVGAYSEIPFDIKLSAFLAAQLFFRKLPYMKTELEVRVVLPGQMYKKNIPLTVGEWYS